MNCDLSISLTLFDPNKCLLQSPEKFPLSNALKMRLNSTTRTHSCLAHTHIHEVGLLCIYAKYRQLEKKNNLLTNQSMPPTN